MPAIASLPSKLSKGLLALFVACGLVVAPTPTAPAERAWAGPAEFVVDKVADEAIELVDGWVVDGLSYMGDDAELDIFHRIGDLTTLPSGKGDRVLEEQLGTIMAQLDDIDQDIKDLSANLDAEIATLESRDGGQSWSTNRSNLSVIGQKYVTAFNHYRSYLAAAQQYSQANAQEDPNRTLYAQRMDDSLQHFVDACSKLDFTADLAALAALSCRAYPAYIAGGSSTKNPTNAVTTLDRASDVCDKTQAYEHQKYETMLKQANECMAPFLMLGMVNRVWTDYQAEQNGGTAPAQALALQETVANETTQAVNDIAGQARAYTKALMHPYDFDVNVSLDSYQSSGETIMKGNHGSVSDEHTLLLNSRWSTPSMRAYQAKPLTGSTDENTYAPSGSSKPFLFLQKNGDRFLKHGDLIAYERDTQQTGSGEKMYDYSDMNQDWYNLQRANRFYTLVDDASSFEDTVNQTSYALSGGNDLFSYYAAYGGMDASLLPSAMDTALTTKWESKAKAFDDTIYPDPDRPGLAGSWCFTYDYIADLSNYALNQSDGELESRVSTADTDPYVYDELLRDKDMLVMLEGMEASQHRYALGVETAGSVSVTVEDENGAALNMASIAPTSSLKVTVTSGNGFAGLDLVDASGTVLDSLLTADEFDFYADGYGMVTLDITMPYQRCTLRASADEPHAEADPSDCAITGTVDGQTLTVGNDLSFAATGSNVDIEVPSYGDERLRPASWSIERIENGKHLYVASGEWTDGPFTSLVATEGWDAGDYRINVVFASERFLDAAWQDAPGGHVEHATVTLVAAKPPKPVIPKDPPAPSSDPTGKTTPVALAGSTLASTGDPLGSLTFAAFAIMLAAAVATGLLTAWRTEASRMSRKDKQP